MKKIVLLIIAVLTFAMQSEAKKVQIISNGDYEVKTGDTVVVRQSLMADELDFPIIPGATVIRDGELVQAGEPEEEGEKVWEFIANQDMRIIKMSYVVFYEK